MRQAGPFFKGGNERAGPIVRYFGLGIWFLCIGMFCSRWFALLISRWLVLRHYLLVKQTNKIHMSSNSVNCSQEEGKVRLLFLGDVTVTH